MVRSAFAELYARHLGCPRSVRSVATTYRNERIFPDTARALRARGVEEAWIRAFRPTHLQDFAAEPRGAPIFLGMRQHHVAALDPWPDFRRRGFLLAPGEEIADPVLEGADFDATFARVAKMPGHRVVVDGLMQGNRALLTLRVISEGAQGVVARLCARSLERGLAQLCAQTAVVNQGLGVPTIADALVSAFDVVLEVARLPDGRTRVVRVAELARGDALPIVGHDIFTFAVERIATGGAVEGSFNPTGRRPHFAAELRSRGARLDTGMFARAARAPYPGG
jgi:hypothetical protein